MNAIVPWLASAAFLAAGLVRLAFPEAWRKAHVRAKRRSPWGRLGRLDPLSRELPPAAADLLFVRLSGVAYLVIGALFACVALAITLGALR